MIDSVNWIARGDLIGWTDLTNFWVDELAGSALRIGLISYELVDWDGLTGMPDLID